MLEGYAGRSSEAGQFCELKRPKIACTPTPYVGINQGLTPDPMPIPVFDINGVIPPFIGKDGPGMSSALMTPYEATAAEVVARFAMSDNRIEILRGWLAHRAALRSLGFVIGFQFIDGSFVEDKEPADIDVVTYSGDPTATSQQQVLTAMQANPAVFSKKGAKQTFRVDAHFVDLRGNIDSVVRATCFYNGLFSHNRPDLIWKGMLRVSLDDPSESAALAALNTPTITAAPVVS